VKFEKAAPLRFYAAFSASIAACGLNEEDLERLFVNLIVETTEPFAEEALTAGRELALGGREFVVVGRGIVTEAAGPATFRKVWETRARNGVAEFGVWLQIKPPGPRQREPRRRR
jgi:uncharacterized protein YcbX